MFDIFINDGSKEIPNDDILYIIGKEGIFLKKKVGIMESIAPVKSISILESVESSAKLNIPKIPAVKFAKVVELFKDVHRRYSSECTAMIHYNNKKKRYRMEVPPQVVTGASVDYKSDVSYPNYDTIGTLHSHSFMGAFHSSTDKNDEEDRDGLHITIGKVGNEFPEISVEIVANGSRFKADPVDYIDGIELVTWEEDRPWTTIDQLSNIENIPTKILKGGYKINVDPKKRMFDRKWLDQIQKKTYTKETILTNPLFKNLDARGYLSTNDIEDIDNDDFNPCERCVFKDYKIEMQIDDLLDDLEYDEDEIEEIGEIDLIDMEWTNG